MESEGLIVDDNSRDEDFSLNPDALSLGLPKKEDVRVLVRNMLEKKLGRVSHFVLDYLPSYKSREKRNTMSLKNTAEASLRCSLSPHDTAIICTEFLKDLISAGYLSQDMAYLACDKSKLVRARKKCMDETNSNRKNNIKGLGYDGRKDKYTRAMQTDINGNTKMGIITEEHVSLSCEPGGEYLTHFVPEEPGPKGKTSSETGTANI